MCGLARRPWRDSSRTFNDRTMNGLSTSSRSCQIELLLRHIPEAHRPAAIKEIVSDLRRNIAGSSPAIALAVLGAHPGDEAREELLAYLRICIEHGNASEVFEASNADEPTMVKLLRNCLRTLQDAAASLCEREDTNGASDTAAIEDDLMPSQSTVSLQLILNWLRFGKLACSVEAQDDTSEKLLQVSLVLMSFTEKQIAYSARDVVLAILVSAPTVIAEQNNALWQHIEHLISPPAASFKQTLGYQLWLRCVDTPNKDDSIFNVILDPASSTQLARGLRYGDSERRKLCLEILKISAARTFKGNGTNLKSELNLTQRSLGKLAYQDRLWIDDQFGKVVRTQTD